MEKRRIVLVPIPAQGHVTPFMQLGKLLQDKGFSITVAHGHYKQINYSSQHFPGFNFVNMPQSLPESEAKRLGSVKFMMKLNEASEESFKDCISQLLKQQEGDNNDIACIIYDELMYFCEAAAKEFKIPSVKFTTCCATNHVCCCVLSKLNADNKFLIDMKDEVVEELNPLRYKDLPTWGFGPLEPLLDVCKEIVKKRSTCAILINTASCLENSSISWLQREFGIQVYAVGPLHVTSSMSSSLLEEDMSCIEWLNKQKPKSVIYVSLGSKAQMETEEMLEMAWGLCDSNQPFLWVIQSGLESLSEEVEKMVLERGYIVKWAPQREVLGHDAVGGFLSHCGWNSTLESIVEGVPMICRPFQGEQKLNAMHIESVWGIGIQLEGEVKRGEVERAVKRLFADEEGAGIREKVLDLKEKLKASVTSGGSSYNALNEFVKYLNTK